MMMAIIAHQGFCCTQPHLDTNLLPFPGTSVDVSGDPSADLAQKDSEKTCQNEQLVDTRQEARKHNTQKHRQGGAHQPYLLYKLQLLHGNPPLFLQHSLHLD